MTDHVWIEMPTVGSGRADDRVRPKYPIHGKAFIIHREGKVYVTTEDEIVQEEVANYADCRPLTPSEARAFEENLPFPILTTLVPHNHDNKSRFVGLGDVVAWLTRKVGVTECSACQHRKRRLNRIVVWGWWRR